MVLHWEGQKWKQSLTKFEEGQRIIRFNETTPVSIGPNGIDWIAVGHAYAEGRGPDWQTFVPDWNDAA
jgi:hypothetical protein